MRVKHLLVVFAFVAGFLHASLLVNPPQVCLLGRKTSVHDWMLHFVGHLTVPLENRASLLVFLNFVESRVWLLFFFFLRGLRLA